MSTVMTNAKFVEKLKDIANNYKTIYVMGCFGAPISGANVERYCNNHDYNKQPARTKMIKNAANKGYYGFDCVNLIKAVLWGWNGDAKATYGGAKYATNGVPDIGADTMITKCKNLSTDFSKIEVGEAVWRKGHIGVYIGNGLAIEATPAWKNKVQITAVANIGAKSGYNSRKWTKHGKLPYISYEAAKPATPAKPTTTKKLEKGAKVTLKKGAKTYTGGSLQAWVYNTTFTVLTLKNDRVVIGLNGVTTAAVNAKDLTVI